MAHPKPLYPRLPKPKRLSERGNAVTVCVAACESATKVVVATDRLLSYAGIVSDNLPGKMIWLDDWLVLYAGLPSNISLIIDAIHEVTQEKITRKNVQQALYAAYQQRKGKMSSFPSLSSYDISLETFQINGLDRFGKSEFARLSQEISQAGRDFNEQLLVVGWGETPNSVMLYEISENGDREHHIMGMATIGVGCDVALSTMMLLDQSRDSSLAETLYTVAAAKFASEKSTAGDVGRKTSIYITWKRTQSDPLHKPPGKFLEQIQINKLYAVWDRYGRPRIADQVFPPVNEILNSMGVTGHKSNAELNAELNALLRLAEKLTISS